MSSFPVFADTNGRTEADQKHDLAHRRVDFGPSAASGFALRSVEIGGQSNYGFDVLFQTGIARWNYSEIAPLLPILIPRGWPFPPLAQ